MNAFFPDHCANCDRALPSDRKALFCSQGCGQIAKAVRCARCVRRDGRINDPDVRYAVKMKLLHALAGGYPEEQRRLALDVRQAVWTRDGGRCQSCGASGEEIDHRIGDSSEPENLVLLCRACHRAKTAQRLRPTKAEESASLQAIWQGRVLPAEPVRLCDSEDWQRIERRLRTERRARVRGDSPRC